jgi:hypothetical protein
MHEAKETGTRIYEEWRIILHQDLRNMKRFLQHTQYTQYSAKQNALYIF